MPGNGVAQRCNSATYGYGYGCAQSMLCVNSNNAPEAYCAQSCAVQGDCPAQTWCAQITTSGGQVAGMGCVYSYSTSGKAAGAACAATDTCVTGYLCDGTCKQQCDGPGGTCATGTCTALVDGSKTIAYVCK